MWSLILSILIQPIFAQSNTDYFRNRDLYQQSYSVYLDKKQVDQQYRSIATQKDLIISTKQAIVTRNNLLSSYLVTIRQSLETNKSTHPEPTALIQKQLNDWEAWLNSQNSLVPNLNVTTDFSKSTSSFQENYSQIKKTITLASIRSSINTLSGAANQINSLVSQLQGDPNFKPEGQNWLTDINLNVATAMSDVNTAINTVTKIQTDSYYSGGGDLDTNELLLHAHDALQSATNNLKTTVVKFYQSQ